MKHHAVCHLAQDAYYLNPRVGWCYGGEDFVGDVAVVTTASTKGTKWVNVIND